MELYMKFVSTLAFGLVGAGMVLKIVLDELFMEWDAVADLAAWLKSWSESKTVLSLAGRREDVLLEAEKSRAVTLNTRLLEERRERLKEISAVEQRLHLSAQKISLTPLPRTPVDTVSAQS